MTTPPDLLVPISRLPCRDQGGLIAAPLGTPASLSLLPVGRHRSTQREPATRPACAFS
jgi:hypothetical protein